MKDIEEEVNIVVVLRSIAFIIVIVSLGISYILSKDIFWTILFLYLFFFTIYFSKQNKHKFLFLTISIFSLFHVVIFPYVYVFFLRYNPDSFLIKEEVFENEKSVAIREITDKYNPKKLEASLLYIDSILNENEIALDSTLQFINNKNILLLNNFFIYMSIQQGDPKAPDTWTAILCDNNGHVLYEFHIPDHDLSETLGNLILTEKTRIDSEIRTFHDRKFNYEEARIWNYSNILWYTINIFDSENISPISRSANIVFSLHKIFFYILMVIIGSSFFDALRRKTN